jgi:transcriptional regulator with XRE-family HTH domain
MVIADRLKELREAKHLSQLDIQQRTGLLRCYISRVENGHTVPAIETLEKLAWALEVPMYQLFHEGEAEASVRKSKHSEGQDLFGTGGAEAGYLSKLRKAMSKLKPKEQKLILHTAQRMAKRA